MRCCHMHRLREREGERKELVRVGEGRESKFT